MATLKVKKHPKMDRKLISSEPWEVNYVVVHFYKWEGLVPIHPTVEDVLTLIKKHNNSRVDVYEELFCQEFIKI